MTAKSNLAEALLSGRTVLTAECLPPRSANAAAFKKRASDLPAGLDAVVVADNPGEVRASALACAALLEAEGRETVLSLATRDRNRIALESDVLGAAALGIRAFLCVSGDHTQLGDRPQSAGVFDMDSIQLTSALKMMATQATDFSGLKLDAALECLIGAVAHPYLRPMELNLLRLEKKVAAGAAFLITQAVFDLAAFTEWMNAVRQAGLDKRTAILASVLPLASVEQAKALAARGTYGPIGDDVLARLAKAADPIKEGISIAAQAATKLKAMPGVRGIHILSGGCEAVAARVIQEAGLSKA